MNDIISSLNYILTSQAVELGDRPAATSLLVAEAVGNALPIPSSAATDVRTFYLTTHKQAVLDQLSCINEVTVIDIDEVESVVYKLWLTRYRFVHEPTAMQSQNLMQLFVEHGTADIPKRFSELSCKYRNLYADGTLLSAITVGQGD